MNVRVCVPYRPGDPHRDIVYGFTRACWEAFGFDVHIGDSDGDWNPAQARNRAAAGDWDVALFVDADVIVADAAQVRDACKIAAASGSYVAPYDRLCWLAEAETARVLAGAPATRESAYHAVRGWLMAFVIGRALWDRVGGFDEAYGQRDGEDVSFFNQARDEGGLSRIPGDAFHLYHPPRPHRYYA